MIKQERKPRLSDVLISNTDIESPNQLAIALAKKASLKKNPVVRAVVIAFHQNDDPWIEWSSMPLQDVDNLLRYFANYLEDEFRIQWREFLPKEADLYEDDAG